MEHREALTNTTKKRRKAFTGSVEGETKGNKR
jgi:hypothetical protein